jgi:hypothetical protein
MGICLHYLSGKGQVACKLPVWWNLERQSSLGFFGPNSPRNNHLTVVSWRPSRGAAPQSNAHGDGLLMCGKSMRRIQLQPIKSDAAVTSFQLSALGYGKTLLRYP